MLQQFLTAILPSMIALLSNIATKNCQCKPAFTVYVTLCKETKASTVVSVACCCHWHYCRKNFANGNTALFEGPIDRYYFWTIDISSTYFNSFFISLSLLVAENLGRAQLAQQCDQIHGNDWYEFGHPCSGSQAYLHSCSINWDCNHHT